MREWTANDYARTDHGISDKNNKQFALEAHGARVIWIRLRFNALPHKSFSLWRNVFFRNNRYDVAYICAHRVLRNITHTECQILDRLLSSMLRIQNFQEKIKRSFFFSSFISSFISVLIWVYREYHHVAIKITFKWNISLLVN